MKLVGGIPCFEEKLRKDNTPPNWRGVVFNSYLRRQIWHQSHVARALDGERYLALLLRGDARTLLAEDLRVRIRELTQVRDILVVDELLMLYFFSF